jgi:hypothetical protein
MPFGPEHKSTFGESMDRLVEPTAHELLCDYVENSKRLHEIPVMHRKDWDDQFAVCTAIWKLIEKYAEQHG